MRRSGRKRQPSCKLKEFTSAHVGSQLEDESNLVEQKRPVGRPRKNLVAPVRCDLVHKQTEDAVTKEDREEKTTRTDDDEDLASYVEGDDGDADDDSDYEDEVRDDSLDGSASELPHASHVMRGERWPVAPCDGGAACDALPAAHAHCPLCTTAHFPADTVAVTTAHFSSAHVRNAVTIGELQILACRLPCRASSSPHFHCPGCGGVEARGSHLTAHLARCTGARRDKPPRKPPLLANRNAQNLWRSLVADADNGTNGVRPALDFGTFTHVSFVHELQDLAVTRCRSCCTKFHCVLCPPDVFRPAFPQKVKDHLRLSHWNHRFSYRGVYLLKCCLPCIAGRTDSHWHCPRCPLKITSKVRLRYHLQCHDNGTTRRRVRRGADGAGTGLAESPPATDDDDSRPDGAAPDTTAAPKVFEVLSAVLSEDLLSVVPGSRTAFLSALAHRTGVRCKAATSSPLLARRTEGATVPAQHAKGQDRAEGQVEGTPLAHLTQQAGMGDEGGGGERYVIAADTWRCMERTARLLHRIAAAPPATEDALGILMEEDGEDGEVMTASGAAPPVTEDQLGILMEGEDGEDGEDGDDREVMTASVTAPPTTEDQLGCLMDDGDGEGEDRDAREVMTSSAAAPAATEDQLDILMEGEDGDDREVMTASVAAPPATENEFDRLVDEDREVAEEEGPLSSVRVTRDEDWTVEEATDFHVKTEPDAEGDAGVPLDDRVDGMAASRPAAADGMTGRIDVNSNHCGPAPDERDDVDDVADGVSVKEDVAAGSDGDEFSDDGSDDDAEDDDDDDVGGEEFAVKTEEEEGGRVSGPGGGEASEERCPRCDRPFENRAGLLHHLTAVRRCAAPPGGRTRPLPAGLARQLAAMDEVDGATCPACARVFRHVRSARTHYALRLCRRTPPAAMTRDPSSLLYACRYCDSFSARLPRLVADHEARVHLARVHACATCDRRYGSARLLHEHVLWVHGEASTASAQCHVCGRLMRAKYLRRHLLVYHDAGQTQVRAARLAAPTPCAVCGFRARTVRGSLRHAARRHGDRRFACGACSATFALAVDLKQHVRSMHAHGGGPAQQAAARARVACDTCGKRMLKKNLEMHVRLVHDKVKQYRCEQCGRLFQTKYTLTCHLETHKARADRTFRFLCSVCGAGFNNRTVHRDHLNMHSGHRPYACDVCGKRFKQISTFSRHAALHRPAGGGRGAGAGRFTCDTCGEAFARRNLLDVHNAEQHAAVLNCICGQMLASVSELRAHQAVCGVWLSQETLSLPPGPGVGVTALPALLGVGEQDGGGATMVTPDGETYLLFQSDEHKRNGDNETILLLQGEGGGELGLKEEPGAGVGEEGVGEEGMGEDGGAALQEFLCGYCQGLFVGLETVQQHMLTVHLDEMPQDTEHIQLELHSGGGTDVPAPEG